MARAKKSVCLVSMPFTPVTMPGLGVSTLKSTLIEAGIRSQIYYGAFDFFRFFTPYHNSDVALFDYNFIASTNDLGELFFATALCGDSTEPLQEALAEILTSPNPICSQAAMEAVAKRILKYAESAAQFVHFCFGNQDWSQYDIVGFSSTFSQNVASLALARKIKEHHANVHIVFGGANCEGPMGDQILRSFGWVDTVIQGEADFTFPEFVSRLREAKDPSSVPGILYRDRQEVRVGARPHPVEDLDSVPYPDFKDYFDQLPALLKSPEVRPQFSLPIETSRGCWWGAVSHCTFCGLNPTTMQFRSKSPQRAVLEFRRLRQYGDYNVFAVDNIISKKYFKEVLPELESDGLRIFYETKANLRESDVLQLSRAGVRMIQPGIEGLSSEILSLMKKGVKGFQNIELLKWCAIYDVHPIWFYLYRFPYEPHESYWREIERSKRLVHLPPPRNPNPVVIDRYSPLFTRSEEFGLKNLRPSGRSAVYYQGLSAAELFNISYHFDADLPQGNALPYEVALWEAILSWNYERSKGARFYQFQGRQTTLLVDSRGEELKVLVLLGFGHDIHDLLRTAQTFEQLAGAFRQLRATEGQDEDQIPLQDLQLTNLATMYGATLIPSPETEADLTRFLRELDDHWIVTEVDDRWISLAVDCTSPLEASKLGLQEFVKQIGQPEASFKPSTGS
jgi:ribosomal peptide maturation radical SAM protein 1